MWGIRRLHINLDCAIKYCVYCKVHPFADDNNLMKFQSSVKTINKLNYDLKILLNWLNADKISINESKTELVMFNTIRNN